MAKQVVVLADWRGRGLCGEIGVSFGMPLFFNCTQIKNNLKIIKKVLDNIYSYLYNKGNKGKQKEEQKNDKV